MCPRSRCERGNHHLNKGVPGEWCAVSVVGGVQYSYTAPGSQSAGDSSGHLEAHQNGSSNVYNEEEDPT